MMAPMLSPMKTYLKVFLLTLIVVIPIVSCTIEHVSNGDLDGFWHVEQIDTLATGGTLDLRDEVRFWAFQAKLLHLQGASNSFYCRFSHEGSYLIVYEPHLDHRPTSNDDEGDPLVTDAVLLHPYGLQTLADTFYVERLSSSQMVLTTPQHRLHFVKF